MATKNKPAASNDFPVIEDTPVISDADALATLNDEPVVAGEFDDGEALPTVEEAREMFDERPGLSSVHTNEGVLNRDGSFAGGLRLTLGGNYVAG